MRSDDSICSSVGESDKPSLADWRSLRKREIIFHVLDHRMNGKNNKFSEKYVGKGHLSANFHLLLLHIEGIRIELMLSRSLQESERVFHSILIMPRNILT